MNCSFWLCLGSLLFAVFQKSNFLLDRESKTYVLVDGDLDLSCTFDGSLIDRNSFRKYRSKYPVQTSGFTFCIDYCYV